MKLLASALVAIASTRMPAQATMPPVNDPPNPYRTELGWAKLPEGRTWGSTSGVAIDKDGKSVWVAERCGTNSCVGSDLAPILHFDAEGNLVKAFGAGMFLTPHGMFVDGDGNIWVTDCSCTQRGAVPATTGPRTGHQVFKFSPDGKLLLTLGTAGGAREPDYFFQPNAILVAPNGTIFVSEGHSSSPGSTARVLKFSRDGKLVASWGKLGADTNDYDQPHALAMDSRGRLFVGDRGNNRIKILDQDGRLLDTWYQFSRPSGILIDRNDNIYVTDSESGSVGSGRARTWKRGIRIGNVRDGKVVAFIPDPNENATNTSAAEGIAVDASGVIYGAEVGSKSLRRYVKQGNP